MKELLIPLLPNDAYAVSTLGLVNINASITLDKDGNVVGPAVPLKTKLSVPKTASSRGSGTQAIAGSDVIKWFVPTEGSKRYQNTLALYTTLLEEIGSDEVKAMLKSVESGAISNADFSQVPLKPKKGKTEAEALLDVRLVFVYAPTGEYIHDLPSLREWWVSNQAIASKPKGDQIVCNITGRSGSRLTKSVGDVRIGTVGGGLFACADDDTYGFGASDYLTSGVTTETATELTQRLNYMGVADDYNIRIAGQTFLVWTDDGSVVPLEQGVNRSWVVPTPVDGDKRKKGKKRKTAAEKKKTAIEITDTSVAGVRDHLMTLFKGAPSSGIVDASSFYSTTITAQKGKLELSPITKTAISEIADNIALYHAKQLRYSRRSAPVWALVRAAYHNVGTAKKPPWTTRDQLALFNHALYGKPVPKMLITKTLKRFAIEANDVLFQPYTSELQIGKNRIQAQIQLLSLSFAYENKTMCKIEELSEEQQQAYALGRVYNYARWKADSTSSTKKNSVSNLWPTLHRNPAKALNTLVEKFPIVAAKQEVPAAAQGKFDKLLRDVYSFGPTVPQRPSVEFLQAMSMGLVAKNEKKADADEKAETTTP